jgi:hypothetical protein
MAEPSNRFQKTLPCGDKLKEWFSVNIALKLNLINQTSSGMNNQGRFFMSDDYIPDDLKLDNDDYERKLLKSRYVTWLKFVRKRSKLSEPELRKIWFTSLSSDDDNNDSIGSAEAMRPPVGGGGA